MDPHVHWNMMVNHIFSSEHSSAAGSCTGAVHLKIWVSLLDIVTTIMQHVNSHVGHTIIIKCCQKISFFFFVFNIVTNLLFFKHWSSWGCLKGCSTFNSEENKMQSLWMFFKYELYLSCFVKICMIKYYAVWAMRPTILFML